MARTIVAHLTVHDLRIGRGLSLAVGGKDGRGAIGVVLNDGDNFSVVTLGETNLRLAGGSVQMGLMNPGDVHHQNGFRRRVLLVVGEMRERQQTVLRLSIQRMTLIAGFAGRDRVLLWNRTVIVFGGYRQEPFHARELSLDEALRPWAGMTTNAFHVSMRSVFVGGVLRFHHRMTGVAAEAGTVHVFDRSVGELPGQSEIHDGRGEHKPRDPPKFRARQAHPRISFPGDSFLMEAPPLIENAKRNQHQTQNEKGRQSDKAQKSQIWIPLRTPQQGRHHEQPHDGRRCHDNYADEADPIARQEDERREPARGARVGFGLISHDENSRLAVEVGEFLPLLFLFIPFERIVVLLEVFSCVCQLLHVALRMTESTGFLLLLGVFRMAVGWSCSDP